MTDSINFVHGSDVLTFEVSAKLTKRASVPKSKDADWKDSSDQWRVTLTEKLYGGEMSFNYWSGVGCRTGRASSLKVGTTAYYENGIPCAPSAVAVLACVGSDAYTGDCLPSDDADALNYMADAFGAGKASDTLRAIRALRLMRYRARNMLLNTGISLSAFADWTATLDC